MDVYQKLIVRINEVAAGKDTVDVDFNDLLKKEGYYQNRVDITDKLSAEGWITERTPGTVRITHWGIMAARKVKANTPDSPNIIDKQATRLKNEVKELSILTEQFNGKATSENFDLIEKKLAEIRAIANTIKEHI